MGVLLGLDLEDDIVCPLISIAMSSCMGQVSNTNQLAAQVAAIQDQVNSLQIRAAGLQRTANLQNTADHDAVADYVLTSGTKCGPQTITGWTEKVDYWRSAANTVETTKVFSASTGLMTLQRQDIITSVLTQGSRTLATQWRCVPARAPRGSPAMAMLSSLTGGPLEPAPTSFWPPRTPCLSTLSLEAVLTVFRRLGGCTIVFQCN